jgi:hypothetical protein
MDSVNVLVEARAALRAASYPLRLPGAAAARESAAALLAQIDDYLVPRLRRMDGPLVAVVGGSTGAGKSTLVNSIVRAPICPAGVLRPTTRAPLLVGHPVDTAWFRERSLLPRLSRGGSGPDGGAESMHPPQAQLHIVNTPQLAPGLALIDAPDIDSVVAANRALARELLGAADLWLFLTTAARYADAVPWRQLREARRRGTAVAIILGRVPPHARDEVSIHFARMLGSQGLGETGLFVVAESTPDHHGLLPDVDIAPIRRWLQTVGGSPAHRDRVLRRTLIGAMVAAGSTVDMLADAADDQADGATTLAATTRAAFDGALTEIDAALRGGALLRGEVYARWRDLVATGELRRAVRARAGRLEVHSQRAEQRPSGRRLLPALARAIAALVSEADLIATRRCREAWTADPAGRALLAAEPALGRPWPGFIDAAHALVHDWSTRLRISIRRQGGPRTRTRSLESAATLVLVTIAAVAPPATDVTAEGVGPDLLRAILEDEHVHGLAEQARADLMGRIHGLFAVEVQRHLAPLAWVDGDLGPRLRTVAARLRDAGRHLAARGEDAA